MVDKPSKANVWSIYVISPLTVQVTQNFMIYFNLNITHMLIISWSRTSGIISGWSVDSLWFHLNWHQILSTFQTELMFQHFLVYQLSQDLFFGQVVESEQRHRFRGILIRAVSFSITSSQHSILITGFQQEVPPISCYRSVLLIFRRASLIVSRRLSFSRIDLKYPSSRVSVIA